MSTQSHTPHNEVVIKVNAYVDEGIKDVVRVLNRFDGWMTWDSCQGNPPSTLAVVEFCPGRVSKVQIPELATFRERFAEVLLRAGCKGTKVQLNRSREVLGYGWISLAIPQTELGSVVETLDSPNACFDNKAHTHPTG